MKSTFAFALSKFGKTTRSTVSRSLVALLVAGSAIVGATVALTTFASAEVFGSDADAIKVIVDRAKVMRLERSAKTIVIGNPLIVDATMQDSKTLVLTGRSYGVTNLIIFDEEGQPLVDETVVVGAHEAKTVRIYRRTARETLACSPVCEPTLTIGDQKDTFDNALDQVQRRNTLSSPQN